MRGKGHGASESPLGAPPSLPAPPCTHQPLTASYKSHHTLPWPGNSTLRYLPMICENARLKRLLQDVLSSFGTSLAVYWLRFWASSAGGGFDPWSGNFDPACHGAWSKITKTKKHCFISNQKWKLKNLSVECVPWRPEATPFNKAIRNLLEMSTGIVEIIGSSCSLKARIHPRGG